MVLFNHDAEDKSHVGLLILDLRIAPHRCPFADIVLVPNSDFAVFSGNFSQALPFKIHGCSRLVICLDFSGPHGSCNARVEVRAFLRVALPVLCRGRHAWHVWDVLVLCCGRHRRWEREMSPEDIVLVVSFHLSCNSCLLRLDSFCHSESGMVGGRSEPCKGFLKMRLPCSSYSYVRPMASVLKCRFFSPASPP